MFILEYSWLDAPLEIQIDKKIKESYQWRPSQHST